MRDTSYAAASFCVASASGDVSGLGLALVKGFVIAGGLAEGV